jgi:hypothetical protein
MAGKMCLNGEENPESELDVKERTVLFYAPLELVSRFPFDKDKSFDFAMFNDLYMLTSDCKISYLGEADIKVNGKMRKLHKFIQKSSDAWNFAEFWLTDKHELIRAKFLGEILALVTETEARKPLADWGAKQGGTDNDVRMSEAVSGCERIRAALRVRFAQYNEYPALDGVAGDQLEPALGVTPAQLEGKNFTAAAYVATSTAKSYTIKAILGAQTYVIDEKGVESGTYRTE